MYMDEKLLVLLKKVGNSKLNRADVAKLNWSFQFSCLTILVLISVHESATFWLLVDCLLIVVNTIAPSNELMNEKHWTTNK